MLCGSLSLRRCCDLRDRRGHRRRLPVVGPCIPGGAEGGSGKHRQRAVGARGRTPHRAASLARAYVTPSVMARARGRATEKRATEKRAAPRRARRRRSSSAPGGARHRNVSRAVLLRGLHAERGGVDLLLDPERDELERGRRVLPLGAVLGLLRDGAPAGSQRSANGLGV